MQIETTNIVIWLSHTCDLNCTKKRQWRTMVTVSSSPAMQNLQSVINSNQFKPIVCGCKWQTPRVLCRKREKENNSPYKVIVITPPPKSLGVRCFPPVSYSFAIFILFLVLWNFGGIFIRFLSIFIRHILFLMWHWIQFHEL